MVSMQRTFNHPDIYYLNCNFIVLYTSTLFIFILGLFKYVGIRKFKRRHGTMLVFTIYFTRGSNAINFQVLAGCGNLLQFTMCL